MKAFVKNASDKKQVKEASKRVLNSNEQFGNDLRSILLTDSGKRVFWHYLELCGVYRSSVGDPTQVFFNEGMRNIGLILLADISRHAPKSYISMITANLTEEVDTDD
jgi:hypothetical protein